MTPAGHRPAALAGWPVAAARGFIAFLAVAGIGQLLALAVWAVGDTGASIGSFAGIGWMYFGAFHHVAIRLEVPDLAVATGSTTSGATSLSVGVALLSITAVAVWLLFLAGRTVADRSGGGAAVRALHGAKVAPFYALPAFALACLVEVRTPLRLGAFASGELHVSLSPWQALAFPFVIAAIAGAAGGLASGLRDRGPDDRRLARAAAIAAGGWRMFVLGVALSLGGLFLAGVVQPDGPEALLTPSTARYLRGVFDRPAPGLVLLAHHLSVFPNEAIWTLVPATGACDAARDGTRTDLLCYGRFPVEVDPAPLPLPGGESVQVPLGGASFGTAPAAYLLFLLVPLLATVLGGRRVAEGLRAGPAEAAVAGAGAGVLFAALVAAGALLATVTISYGAAFAGGTSAGRVVVGPDVIGATLLALAWGVLGGGLGAAAASRLSSEPGRKASRARAGRPRT